MEFVGSECQKQEYKNKFSFICPIAQIRYIITSNCVTMPILICRLMEHNCHILIPRTGLCHICTKKGTKHACSFRLEKSAKEHERVREAVEKYQPGRRTYIMNCCYTTNVTFIFGTKSLIKDEEVLIKDH